MKPKSMTHKLTLCALFAALTAICSQIQIPLPMIPINLALLSVHLAGTLLGAKYGSLSMAVYVVLGLVGVPVFSSFTGGPGILFGKTGGYIVGYILAAFVVGMLTQKTKLGKSFWGLCVAMVAGVLACYALGTLWFMMITHMTLWVTLGYCVVPFLPGDALKILLAALLTQKLKSRLLSSGWL